MKELLKMLQDISDLYTAFGNSKILLKIREDAILKIKYVDEYVEPVWGDDIQRMFICWAEKSKFRTETSNEPLLSDKELEKAVNKYGANLTEDSDKDFIINVESVMFALNKEDRNIFSKRLLKKMTPLIRNEFNLLFLGTIGLYIYKLYNDQEGDIILERVKKVQRIVAFVKNSTKSLIDLFNDFDIDIRYIISELEIADTDLCLLKNDLLSSLEEIRKDWTLIYTPLIDKIYKECNDNQWVGIAKNDFIKIINGSDPNLQLTIKKGEVNRTKVIFRMIGNNISDKNTRQEWIERIKTHIFGGVDFMKATLRTDTLSGGYSEKDAQFQQFIENL